MDFSFLGGDNAQGNYVMNPEFIRALGMAGSSLGQGKSVGESLGGTAMDLLRMQALQGKNPQIAPPQSKTPFGSGLPQVTAPNMPGPNKVDQTTSTTPDGIVTTTKTIEPHPSQLTGQNQNTAMETRPATTQMGGEVQGQSPFWRALLGQQY